MDRWYISSCIPASGNMHVSAKVKHLPRGSLHVSFSCGNHRSHQCSNSVCLKYFRLDRTAIIFFFFSQRREIALFAELHPCLFLYRYLYEEIIEVELSFALRFECGLSESMARLEQHSLKELTGQTRQEQRELLLHMWWIEG